VLDPLAAPVDGNYLWANADPLRLETAAELPGDPLTNARLTLNTAHPRPWGWRSGPTCGPSPSRPVP
jgi:hypothetical protein